MSKKSKTILLTALSIILVGVLAFLIYFIASGSKATGDGIVVVEYVGIDGKIIKSKDIAFNDGDIITVLIEENFDNVVFSDGMLMAIEDYETPSDWSTFIAIYVDGVSSNYGLSAPEFSFQDGTIISLRITENTYA